MLVGKLRLAATSLWCADQPGARLVVYTPLDAHGREAVSRFAEMEPWVPWTQAGH
jgi:hypothetical protein